MRTREIGYNIRCGSTRTASNENQTNRKGSWQTKNIAEAPTQKRHHRILEKNAQKNPTGHFEDLLKIPIELVVFKERQIRTLELLAVEIVKGEHVGDRGLLFHTHKDVVADDQFLAYVNDVSRKATVRCQDLSAAALL